MGVSGDGEGRAAAAGGEGSEDERDFLPGGAARSVLFRGEGGLGSSGEEGGVAPFPEGDEDVPAPFAMLQYPILRTGGGQSRAEATLNLLNNLLGAGLLAMPRAMAHSGLITGLAMLALIAVANRFTLLMVLELSQTQLQKSSYPEIGRHIFGQQGLLVVLGAILLLTGGVLSAYLIAITDVLQLVPALSGLPRVVLVAIAVAVCSPGAMLKSLRHVAVLSGLCMVGVLMLVIVLTLVSVGDALSPDLVNAPIDDAGRAGDVDWFRFSPRRLLAGASLFTLQFSVHAGGIEVLSRIGLDEGGGKADEGRGRGSGAEEEGHGLSADGRAEVLTRAALDAEGGEEKGAAAGAGDLTSTGDLMRRRAPEPMEESDGAGHEVSSMHVADSVSKLAFTVAVACSAIIGVAGYLRFGDRVQGDVLLSFGQRPHAKDSVALMLARLSYAVVVTCSFAFIMVPCRFTAMDVFALRRRDLAGPNSDLPPDMFKKVTGCILGVCALFAWLVSDLARMLELVGMWSTSSLSFILPCAFFIEVKRRQQGTPVLSADNALLLGLMAFGFLVAVGGTIELLAGFFVGEPAAEKPKEPVYP